MCIAKQQDSFHFASPVGRSLRYGWTGVGISASGRGLRRIAGKRKENRVHMIQYPSCCSSPCRPPPSQGRRGRSGAVRSDEERCPLPVPDSRFRFVGSSRTFWVGGGLIARGFPSASPERAGAAGPVNSTEIWGEHDARPTGHGGTARRDTPPCSHWRWLQRLVAISVTESQTGRNCITESNRHWTLHHRGRQAQRRSTPYSISSFPASMT